MPQLRRGRPRQDSNLRTRLRRPHPRATLTCMNAPTCRSVGRAWGAEKQGSPGRESGCSEAFHWLAGDLGDDVEVLVEVQDGEPG